MGPKHRRQDRDAHDTQARQTVAIYLTISFAVVFAAIAAAVVVRTADSPAQAPATPPAAAATAPSAQSISQEGRLLSVTATSLTARGADGVARTYVVTPETNAITDTGSRVGGTAGAFSVDDEVAIVGEVRGGTAVATAVAHRSVTGLAGPPMDFATP